MHEVTKEGQDRDLLLPEVDDPELLGAFKVILYNLMRHDSLFSEHLETGLS